MNIKFERFGSIGAIVAAAACPVCFPKLAVIGAVFGLGALAEYETLFFFGTQILVLIALIGNIRAYRVHRNRVLLATAVFCSILFFVSLYVFVSEILSYIALTGLVVMTLWSGHESRRCSRCETGEAPENTSS